MDFRADFQVYFCMNEGSSVKVLEDFSQDNEIASLWLRTNEQLTVEYGYVTLSSGVKFDGYRIRSAVKKGQEVIIYRDGNRYYKFLQSVL